MPQEAKCFMQFASGDFPALQKRIYLPEIKLTFSCAVEIQTVRRYRFEPCKPMFFFPCVLLCELFKYLGARCWAEAIYINPHTVRLCRYSGIPLPHTSYMYAFTPFRGICANESRGKRRRDRITASCNPACFFHTPSRQNSCQ